MLKSSLQIFSSLLMAAALVLLTAAGVPARAQSGDVTYPTPVFSGEVSGRIAPRDVGDPRRTRHFYTFRGTEGDLVVSLETSQLSGAVDVFTATTLRPLLKFTLFGDPARLSKSFYLRRDETLVLRVEARAVGDVEGTYTVRFGGSFAPAPAELADAPERAAPTLSPAEPRRGGTRRVTSTGARIEEPKPEPTPVVEEAREDARPAATPAPERSAERRSPTTSRRGRGTRNPSARSRAGTTPARPDTARPETAGTTPAEASSAPTPPTTEATPAPSPIPTRRRTPRRGAARRSETAAQPAEGGQPEPAAPAPPVVTAQRLVIVTKEGETLERDMSGVRRVTVENNQVVIVGRDGKVTRRPLASVVRMSIEP